MGPGAQLHPPCYIVNPHAIHLGPGVSIWHHARIEAVGPDQPTPKVTIGRDTMIQPYAHIGGARDVTIGANVLIASNVYITDHDHDWSDPADPPRHNDRLIVLPVRIEDDVWIGERVTILKGVTIGAGTIIGAGSIVTRSVPSRCVAVGAPARVVKRYDESAGAWVSVDPDRSGSSVR